MAGIPGGSMGLLVRRVRSVLGPDGRVLVPEYEVDTGVMQELNALEEQAARELGQRVGRADCGVCA